MFNVIGANVNGAIQHYDMFDDGKWLGSRRTVEQCEHDMQRKADCRMVRFVDRCVLGSEKPKTLHLSGAVLGNCDPVLA